LPVPCGGMQGLVERGGPTTITFPPF
jgi:hypothetical protein